ncbi:hypothetical protein [Flavobacterium laiguense]|nr:hypothetical protein [Flavobacterium laiguense]
MHEILQEYDNKIAEIERRTKRDKRLTFIDPAIYLAIVVNFGWIY